MNKEQALKQLNISLEVRKDLKQALQTIYNNKDILKRFDNKVINVRLENALKELETRFKDIFISIEYIYSNKQQISLNHRKDLHVICSFDLETTSTISEYRKETKRLNFEETIKNIVKEQERIETRFEAFKKSIKDYDKMIKDYKKLEKLAEDFKKNYDPSARDTLDIISYTFSF